MVRSSSLLLLMAATATATQVQYSAEALAHELHSLPGLPGKLPFRMFSGYVPVAADRKLFFWFVESERSPAEDPLVLWTNGGPGCSGLGGFMTEQGPFRPTANGTLELNTHAWNKLANMVFIEQPAGVGFSTAGSETEYGDAQAAEDNTAFLRGFLKVFGGYNQSALYLSSESYGGHYLPSLAKQLVTTQGACGSDKDCPGSYCMDDKTKRPPYRCHAGRGPELNFKGFIVGNPLTYMPYRDFGMYGTFAGHNLLPKPLWDAYLSAGCRTSSASAECQKLTDQMDQLTAGLDPYALDFPVCTTGGAAGRRERHTLLSKLGKLGGYFPEEYKPCDSNWAAAYLNKPEVQSALGVNGRVKWSECSEQVSSRYSQKDVNAPMMPIYKFLIEGGFKLHIMVYSGDDDAVCATLGSQQWIWELGYNVSEAWAPWTIDGQIAGYRVKFGGAFEFVTVHGAGHMVPATRPAQALEMFGNYLSGKW